MLLFVGPVEIYIIDLIYLARPGKSPLINIDHCKASIVGNHHLLVFFFFGFKIRIDLEIREQIYA